MLHVGQKIKTVIKPSKEDHKNHEKYGYISSLTKHIVTVMYVNSSGKDTYRNSISISDVADDYIQLYVRENREWVKVTMKDFEELKK